jgi:L-ascorbate metabolism protein UlaG (beta-lactamase superfamily)
VTIPYASALEALLAPGARQRNDRSVFSAESVQRHGERLAPRLELEWLGTAGFRISYEGFDLLVDPYVTRHGLRKIFSSALLFSDEQVVRARVPSAGAILVGHTHFDHALDVPKIAAINGCPVYGSSSLTRLMRLYGVGERAIEVTPKKVYPIGPFEVTFIESTHAKLIAGLKVPDEGELSCDHLDGLRRSAYRCGQVYGIHIAAAGTTLYHQGSADLLDDRVMHRGVDYFLAGIAGRGFTRDYTRRILSLLEPRMVIPHHYDDFFRPLGGVMGFSLNVNLGGFFDEVRRVSADFAVRTLTPLEPWGERAASRGPGE